MKTLYLLTNSFPYGDWEPYLETEIKYYDNFDEVYIFALQIRKEHLKRKRTVGNNVKVIPIMKASNKTYLLYSFRTLTDINLYKEFARLVKSRRLYVRNFVNMFVYFSRSHYEADLIDKKMKGHVNKESIFYSYRFEYQPYVAMLLKKKWELNSKIVSRAHRYDLYEEEHKGNYIPMREGILSKIDNIYPCSDHGTDYLRKRFPQYKQKVHTRFLGTIDHGEKEYLFNDKCYEIVSCSTVTKVKRLDLLINALSQIKAIPIKWTHYGDGILMDEIKKIGVIGAGSFGTALAMTLTQKGHEVTLWARRTEQIEEMRRTRQNPRYLPEIPLPETLDLTDDLQEAVTDKDLLLMAVPAQTFRGVFTQVSSCMDARTPIVNVAKGIEKGSLLRLSEVARQILPEVRYAALSGPSHAEEVARALPTTVVTASEDADLAIAVQDVFSTERFRVYTNEDLIGVELGGALKNIIALGAGISDGLRFGDNAKAAMMTRGITEMTRLGLALGARAETFAGLAGIGDLIVTCTSMHSRNRRCGILIGQGKSVPEAVAEVGMVVEGLSTAEAAAALSEKCQVEMPITHCIYHMIQGSVNAMDAVKLLMGRERKKENIIL